MANPNSESDDLFTQNAADTEAAGFALAGRLAERAVVVLGGPLGAGKTCFVRGLAAGLGCGEPVSSPSYAIVHEYFGTAGPVYHFDFYRLETGAELEVIGLSDYLESGICLIEWGGKFPDSLPAAAWKIELEPLPENGGRRIRIHAP